jgi:hypothetical protein
MLIWFATVLSAYLSRRRSLLINAQKAPWQI